MAAPNDGGYGQYPPQPYGEQAEYADPSAQGYEGTASPPPQAGAHQAADHGRKKKRAYAAGAFDVAAGGNAAVGGQLPGAGQYGVPQQAAAPAYGGYPQPDASQAPAYGGVQPQYGVPQPVTPGVGGYQVPEPYYPSPGAQPAPGGVGGITAGFSSMQLGAGAGSGVQQSQQLPPQVRPGPLNQLYPTDLLNQPFNVSELDLPPPPIILPPNVSRRYIADIAVMY